MLPRRDNVEHTLVRLKGIFSGSPHLGGIQLIFTVILCPALGTRDLSKFSSGLCGFLSSKQPPACWAELVWPGAAIPVWCQPHTALAQGTGDNWGSFKWRREKKWSGEQEGDEVEEDSKRGKGRTKPGKGSWLQMPLSLLRKLILGAAPEGSPGNWCYLV